VDAQLARVLDSMVNKKAKPPASVEGALRQLIAQLVHCGRLMKVGCELACVACGQKSRGTLVGTTD